MYPKEVRQRALALLIKTQGDNISSRCIIVRNILLNEITDHQVPALTTLMRWADKPYAGKFNNSVKTARTQQNVDILKNLNDSKNGKISLRSAKAEVNLNISVGSISTILKKDLKLHPYKPISATLLTPQHKGQRKQFCEFILNEYANDPTFHYKIIFTDETQQDLNPCVNHQNNRRWSSSQPYDYEELTAQAKMESISLQQVQSAIDNFIERCRLCLLAEGGHFSYK